MSFPDVRTAIHTALRTYTGVTNIIGGMPTNIHHAPAWITQFESSVRIGQSNVYHHRFLLHAVMDYQANDIAESEIDTMVPLAHQAFSIKLVDGDGINRARLGGTAQMCWFEEVRSGDADGYITFGSGEFAKTYRRIAFVLMVKTHEEY